MSAAAVCVRTGVCRYCGCTDEQACCLPDGYPCCWVTVRRDRCNNPDCLAAHARALGEAAAPASCQAENGGER